MRSSLRNKKNTDFKTVFNNVLKCIINNVKYLKMTIVLTFEPLKESKSISYILKFILLYYNNSHLKKPFIMTSCTSAGVFIKI